VKADEDSYLPLNGKKEGGPEIQQEERPKGSPLRETKRREQVQKLQTFKHGIVGLVA